MEELAVITALTLLENISLGIRKNCYSPTKVGPHWEKTVHFA